MHKALLLTSLLLLAPATAADAPEAECMGTPCDEVNMVCETLGGGQCLGREAPADAVVDCASSVCTEVNERVCRPHFGIDCVY